jgi:hypothetical protein
MGLVVASAIRAPTAIMTASTNGPHSTQRERERLDHSQNREWRADIGTSGAPPWSVDTGGSAEALSNRQRAALTEQA